jgi:hypothetical protein
MHGQQRGAVIELFLKIILFTRSSYTPDLQQGKSSKLLTITAVEKTQRHDIEVEVSLAVKICCHKRAQSIAENAASIFRIELSPIEEVAHYP